MIIQNSSIALSASHNRVEERYVEERFRFWVGNGPPEAAGTSPSVQAEAVLVNLSETALALNSTAGLNEPEWSPGKEELLKIDLIERFIEILTGKRISIQYFRGSFGGECPESRAAGADSGSGRAGWGLEYDYYERNYEREVTTFSAQGIVHTVDGRKIEISVDLSMSREFLEEHRISIRAGDAVLVDPLVINFNGRAAELTTTRFHFDLDADGTDNYIPFLKAGSGFLALDRNNDGTINDGSELFGPTTGNGFAELARYDDDNNGWIDRNDAIYHKLRVWTRDARGNDRLFALGSLGIGAIYLGSVETPFDLNAPGSTKQGHIARTGIYLNDNGSSGTIQHVDLVV